MANYKIGMQNKTFHHWGEDRYRKARELGFTHLDFDLCDCEVEYYDCSEDEMYRRLIHEKEMMDEAGIAVSQVHGPWIWPPQDFTEEDRAGRLAKMQRSLRGTKLLDCKYWVIHPLMPYGYDQRVSNPGHEQETWDINIKFMREILKTAKELDITICLENMPMPDFPIGSPAEILRFVEQINDDHFQICLDTGHVSVYTDKDVAAAVRLFGDHMKVMHVHDNNGYFDIHSLPFFGVINWKQFSESLKEINYQGVLSFECNTYKHVPDPYFEQVTKMLYEFGVELLK